MTKEEYNNLDAIIEGDSRELNVVESLIGILNTPIAKRKGIIMTPDMCAEWSNELKNFLKTNNYERAVNRRKAKRYDEAIERAKEYWKTDNDNTLDIKAKGTMEYLFPELTGSKDERIRKALIHLISEEDGFLTEIDGINVKDILSFLDTLDVKEVDIEKEVMDWWNTYYSSKDYTFERYTGHYLENSTLIEIAKHFFELGLQAQKGE